MRGATWWNFVEMMPRPTPESPGKNMPAGAFGITVDSVPPTPPLLVSAALLGINAAVRFDDSTGGVSISHRTPRFAVKRGVMR